MDVALRSTMALGLAGLSLLACVGRPDAQRCEALADHVVELGRAAQVGRAAEIAAAVASERRQALFERCLADGTVAEVECVLAADSLAAEQRCAP